MTGSNSGAFAESIRAGDCRDAIASIMGQNPIGIDRSKRLLIEFDKLEINNQEQIIAWSQLPSVRLPVKNEHKWYVEEIARHEMAHIIVAKAVGFGTGEATLVLHSPDGSHQGTSVIYLECSTPSLKSVSTYLDRRIMVLLAGYLAEPVDALDRQTQKHQIIQSKMTESDLQKVLELIQLKLNIEVKLDPNAIESTLHAMTEQASAIVEANFNVISSLAQKLADRVEFYEQCVGWSRGEIDNQPEIQLIINI